MQRSAFILSDGKRRHAPTPCFDLQARQTKFDERGRNCVKCSIQLFQETFFFNFNAFTLWGQYKVDSSECGKWAF